MFEKGETHIVSTRRRAVLGQRDPLLQRPEERLGVVVEDNGALDGQLPHGVDGVDKEQRHVRVLGAPDAETDARAAPGFALHLGLEDLDAHLGAGQRDLEVVARVDDGLSVGAEHLVHHGWVQTQTDDEGVVCGETTGGKEQGKDVSEMEGYIRAVLV